MASNIHVFGTELIIQEGQYIDYLSGKWEDGTSFNISLWNRYGVKTKDYITLHEVPEPCTLSLLALGVFLAGRKRK